MKKLTGILLCILVVALCAFALADVEISKSNFPDPVFRKYIETTIDTDGNGKLSDAEIAATDRMEIAYDSESPDAEYIKSLDGIEYFSSLTYLNCFNHKITSLDVSRNLKLEELWCSYNPLKKLDVSKNTALKVLSCYDNGLTTLDLSKNTKLLSLYCGANDLGSLDVSKNTALVTLFCVKNSLKTLDISKNTALKNLRCHNNELTKLDLSKNKKLVCLWCNDNKLTRIDVSSAPTLKALVEAGDPDYTTGDNPKYGWWNTDQTEYIYMDKSVKVVTNGGGTVSVSSIKLNKTKATLTRTAAKKKPTLQLTATVGPADADDLSVEWSSSDPKVAKVSQKGKVTALKPGTVVITCTAKDGSGVKATCKITVKDKLVSKITLNKTKASIKKGKTLELSVKTIKPAEAVNQQVEWTTSDKKIATVDKNGVVTAKKKGTCVITCTAKDSGKKQVTCEITVK